MATKHGVFVLEDGTAITAPIVSGSGAQVVIGTAPVNLVPNPAAVVNVPILANSASEAMAALGYSDDLQDYTLCQSMYVTNNVHQVGPVVYINVLDPATHKKTVAEEACQVSNKQAVVKKKGMLVNAALVIKSGSTALAKDTDYTTEFDSDGYLVISLVANGAGASATSITVSGEAIDPSKVSKSDVIGSYNASTGAETGAELIRQVYPKLGVVPGLIIAPGWSKDPEVGIALAAKAANINGVFKAMAIVDLDSSAGHAVKYTDCKQVKADSGFTSAFSYPVWPCVKIGSRQLAFSAVAAALVAYTDTENDDVPCRSASNKSLGITGICLEDGTEVVLDQDQASTVNTYGVATAINVNGWKLWGNYTGAYPSSGDAKDIWFPVRRMFNWQGNNFILSYFSKVDDPMNYVLIESVVDSENIRCAAYAPDKWAGAAIEYLEADNPVTDVLAGKMTFRQRIAPYTPAQEINNVLTYDISMLQEALLGGE